MSEKHMTFIDSVVAHDPEINVIEKDIMTERIALVFDQIANTLQRSLGPVGSHAIISQSPNYHVTKDGFTIMKNIRYNSEYGYVDNVIAGMISDICGRLNFAVGDGTTSAVVASNCMFQAFNENADLFKNAFVLPRNMISQMKKLTEKVIDELSCRAIDIRSLDIDDMCNYIREVVYVSSNADEEMTDTIVNLYRQIGFPAISVVKAADGITKGKIINGFMFHAKLMDKIYVNNDDNTLRGNNFDVVIFDHKVSLDCYKNILHPLSFMSKLRGRKLICIAPNYDEVALHGDILNNLNAEYRATKDISLIIMGYRASRNSDKVRIQDLAMLCDTQIITQSLERDILKKISIITSNPEYDGDISAFSEVLNIDGRDIPDIKVLEMDGGAQKFVDYYEGYKALYSDVDNAFRVGFCGFADLTLDKESVFGEFRYNESLYNKYVSDAKKELDDTIEKYKRLGTFNFETTDAQRRYLGLKLKMGIVEVGSNSNFSQEFLVDAMDDAVKAAESAYRNGIILGGHVTLLRALIELVDDSKSSSEVLLLNTLKDAFMQVRKCAFSNGFTNKPVTGIKNIKSLDDILKKISEGLGIEVLFPLERLVSRNEIDDLIYYINEADKMDLFTLINQVEVFTNTILNLDIKGGDEPYIQFDKSVINSAATDREILVAASDLVGLLITGNQLVISRGNYGM